MTVIDALKKRIPLSLATASLAVVLCVAAAVAVIGLRGARADQENPGAAATPARATLERIENILRDEGKDPGKRVKEALEALESSGSAAQGRAGVFHDPFFDGWASPAEPFAWGDWDPWREMNRMRLRMDRLFDDAFTRLGGRAPGAFAEGALGWSPRGEFEETADAYIYRFDLPGVDKGEVAVTLEDGRLILEGRRRSALEESSADKGFLRREILHGEFHRVIPLPADVDFDGAMESNLDDGVLTVRLPKREDAASSGRKSIEID